MSNIKTVLNLCSMNIKRWATNPRYYVLLLLIGMLMHYVSSPILKFSIMVGVPVTPWIFPFISTDHYINGMLILGMVLLFCDAPFMNDSTPYECIRSGRKKWLYGQYTYILTASLLFTLTIMACSIICLLPNICFELGWGRVFRTLAQTNAGAQYSLVPISYGIQQTYSPLQAMFLSGTLFWLATIFIGMLIFTLNLVTQRIGGTIMGFVLAFCPFFAYEVGGGWIFYLIPTAWINIQMLDISGNSRYPSVTYAIIFLVAVIFLFMVIVSRIMKKQEVEVLSSI